MGSGTGARWIIILVVYFALLTFITTLVDTTYAGENATFDETQHGLSFGSCDQPRKLYEPYERGIVYKTGIEGEWQRQINEGRKTVYDEYRAGGSIECSMTSGVQSNESCQSINGCKWTQPEDSFFQRTIDWITFWSDSPENPPTCTGIVDYADFTTNNRNYLGTTVINFHDNTPKESVCRHPDVIGNETLCKIMSCTWYNTKSPQDINAEEVDIGFGLMKDMWKNLQEMFTFRFDYGMDNEMASYMLNFFTFHLPMIILVLSLVVVVRS